MVARIFEFVAVRGGSLGAEVVAPAVDGIQLGLGSVVPGNTAVALAEFGNVAQEGTAFGMMVVLVVVLEKTWDLEPHSGFGCTLPVAVVLGYALTELAVVPFGIMEHIEGLEPDSEFERTVAQVLAALEHRLVEIDVVAGTLEYTRDSEPGLEFEHIGLDEVVSIFEGTGAGVAAGKPKAVVPADFGAAVADTQPVAVQALVEYPESVLK